MQSRRFRVCDFSWRGQRGKEHRTTIQMQFSTWYFYNVLYKKSNNIPALQLGDILFQIKYLSTAERMMNNAEERADQSAVQEEGMTYDGSGVSISRIYIHC
jgi:hypothetical protein